MEFLFSFKNLRKMHFKALYNRRNVVNLNKKKVNIYKHTLCHFPVIINIYIIYFLKQTKSN